MSEFDRTRDFGSPSSIADAARTVKIYTIWECPQNAAEPPWLVMAVDEFKLEENGTPVEYIEASQRDQYGKRREMVIEIPLSSLMRLFDVPTVSGKVEP